MVNYPQTHLTDTGHSLSTSFAMVRSKCMITKTLEIM